MCKYGSECMFAHPQAAPFYNGPPPSQMPYPPSYDSHGQPQSFAPNGYYGVPPTHAFPPPQPNGIPNGAPHSPTQHTTAHAPSPHAAPFHPSNEGGAPPPQPQSAPAPVPGYTPYPAPPVSQQMPPPPPPNQQNGVHVVVPISPVAAYHSAVMPVVPMYAPQPTSPVHHRTQSNGYVQQQAALPPSQLNGLDENHVMKNGQYGEENGHAPYYSRDHVPRRGGFRRPSMSARKPPCLFFPAGKCKNGYVLHLIKSIAASHLPRLMPHVSVITAASLTSDQRMIQRRSDQKGSRLARILKNSEVQGSVMAIRRGCMGLERYVLDDHSPEVSGSAET